MSRKRLVDRLFPKIWQAKGRNITSCRRHSSSKWRRLSMWMPARVSPLLHSLVWLANPVCNGLRVDTWGKGIRDGNSAVDPRLKTTTLQGICCRRATAIAPCAETLSCCYLLQGSSKLTSWMSIHMFIQPSIHPSIHCLDTLPVVITSYLLWVLQLWNPLFYLQSCFKTNSRANWFLLWILQLYCLWGIARSVHLHWCYNDQHWGVWICKHTIAEICPRCKINRWWPMKSLVQAAI
jgi:hypothetical protein